jgi:hypothetical protein
MIAGKLKKTIFASRLVCCTLAFQAVTFHCHPAAEEHQDTVLTCLKRRNFRKQKFVAREIPASTRSRSVTSRFTNFQDFGRLQSFDIISTSRLKKTGTAISRWFLRMTVTETPFDQYYAKYAPRTHGLPMSVPLHAFPRGREFYKAIGEPKRVVAPMVDQSELVVSLGGFLMVGVENAFSTIRSRVMLHAHDSREIIQPRFNRCIVPTTSLLNSPIRQTSDCSGIPVSCFF